MFCKRIFLNGLFIASMALLPLAGSNEIHTQESAQSAMEDSEGIVCYRRTCCRSRSRYRGCGYYSPRPNYCRCYYRTYQPYIWRPNYFDW